MNIMISKEKGVTTFLEMVTPNLLIFKELLLFLYSSLGGGEACDGHTEGRA